MGSVPGAISYVAVRGQSTEEGAVQRILDNRRVASIRNFTLGGGKLAVEFVFIRKDSASQLTDIIVYVSSREIHRLAKSDHRQGPGMARARQRFHHPPLRPPQEQARGQSDIPCEVLTIASYGITGFHQNPSSPITLEFRARRGPIEMGSPF